MKPVRSLQILLGMAILLWSADAVAMSCAPFEDRFIVECREETCLPILRAQDVGAFGNPCSRRLKVQEAPPWIVGEMRRVSMAARWETGLHSITYEYDFAADPRSLEELHLAARTGERVLSALEGTKSSIKDGFKKREASELWDEHSRKAVEIVVGMVLLALIAWSTRSFWQRLSCRDGDAGLRKPVSAQVGLAMGGIAWIPLFALSGYGLALVLAAPVVLLVLAIEMGGWFLVSRRRRAR